MMLDMHHEPQGEVASQEADTFLPYTMQELALEQLIIPDEQDIRVTSDMIESVSAVGILVPLLVEQLGEESGLYRVIDGRKRATWAKAAGLERVTCKVYGRLDTEMRSVFILNTNWNRSPSWVIELRALHQLVTQQVGMTDRMIARRTGASLSAVREHLKIALLPAPILERIFAGKMSKEAAKRAARLTPKQRERLIRAIEQGQQDSSEDNADGLTVTPDLVKGMLREQVGAGLAAVLPQIAASAEDARAFVQPSEELVAEAGRATVRHAYLAEMSEMAAGWQAWLADQPNSTRAQFLLAAFAQEIAILSRQA